MDDTTTSSHTVTSDGPDLPPDLPPDSPGSSVSSTLQEEYEEILKYAVVIPSYNPKASAKTLTDAKGSFLEEEPPREPPNPATRQTLVGGEEDDDTEQGEELAGGHIILNGAHYQTSCLPSQLPSDREHALDDEDFCNHDDEALPRQPLELTSPMDSDYERMESVLDTWSYELKKNVLAELSRLKIKIADDYQRQLAMEKARNMTENRKLQDDMTNLREMLLTYESSAQRKDEVIQNLSLSLEYEKDLLVQQKDFYQRREQLENDKREAFTSAIANQHYERTISRKVCTAWRSIITDRWQNRVERACQAKATEVCMSLTNDYEARIEQLTEELEAAGIEISRLNHERDCYEQTMKKAFMRGVCALNVEAMNMFQESERREFRDTLQTIADVPRRAASPSDHVTQDLNPCPRIVTSLPSASAQRQDSAVQAKTVHFAPNTKSSTNSSKKSAPTGSGSCRSRDKTRGNVPLAPPMSSVVVERHQPITKQTISHALASQFPRSRSYSPTTAASSDQEYNNPPTKQAPAQFQQFKKIAGQSDANSKTISHVTTVKVVE